MTTIKVKSFKSDALRISSEIRVLLIEDSPIDARLMSESIHRSPSLQANLDHAESLSDALKLLNSNQYSAILLDLNLPDSCGLETVSAVHHRAIDTPIIVVTGQDDEALAVAAAEKGAQDYLVKGEFSQNLLVRTLRYAMKRKKLEVERHRLATALEQASDFIMITDNAGEILYVNPALEDVTGYHRNELIGENPRILKSGKHDKAFYRELWKTIEKGRIWEGHFVNKKKDGTLYSQETTISPVRDDAGEVINFVSVGRDVTEKLALETHLAQARKLESIGRLAAGIAHEINTPIQYIGDNVRFLQECCGEISNLLEKYTQFFGEAKSGSFSGALVQEIEDSIAKIDLPYVVEEIPKSLEETLEGIARVAKIVLAMKEFSHPGSKDKVQTDINKAIENTTTVSRNEWKYVANLEVDLDPNIPLVPCLPGELNQVFLNLIVNSAHAIAERFEDQSEPKGTIKVRTLNTNGHVEIQISDNGKGIPQEIRDKIFDPFFTTKEIGRGTGQGLAIAHSVIVDKHRGSLQFKSKTNEGTTFIIRLPIHAEEGDAE